MKKAIQRLLPLAALMALGLAQATAVRLETSALAPAAGSQFNVRIMADIDLADEIIGFGFDLLASANIGFVGFTAATPFADDPVYLAPFSDSDGIRGAAGGDLLLGAPVSGNNILLGILLLRALADGPAVISLSADDLGGNFTEGLIPLSPLLVNFMPSLAPVTVTVGGSTVAEPGGLASLALLALLVARRRRVRQAGARV